MAKGFLQVDAATADEALPVSEALVRVSDDSGTVIFEGMATENGELRPIELDAPDPADSLEPSGQIPYAKYDVSITKAGYYPQTVKGVQIFGGERTTLPVEMIPLPGNMEEFEIVYPIGENALLQDYVPQTSYAKQARILGEVYIPDKITVHLGSPSSSASNVTVPFIDYIKNVASSEIYPTWPENALRANILAEISLALNRIYTEWYRSQGYPFDITSSTAYDQYYVHGRNIYDSISTIVDEIFNNYLRKPGRQEPFYAEYCNGTSVTCPGMSQWGTVYLANQGYSPLEILKFYYGDIDIVTSNDIRGIEESYPGYPLSAGSSGEPVRVIQEQLNRTAINYPAIPLGQVDGIFGEKTAAAVKAFQRLFGLTADGIVGKKTWYRLSYIYTAIKKLAELSSEGQRVDYSQQSYPGFALKQGSIGSEVQEIQFYLSRIAAFNSSIPSVKIDGRYGAGTANAVRAFQSFYGLVPDGVVGSRTWNKLVDVYNGTVDNVEENNTVAVRDYPGTPVTSGSTGANVLYIQSLLNGISDVFRSIPKLSADGIYGAKTAAAVKQFQRIFGLSADGVVGPVTWNRLGSVYSAVKSGCVTSSTPENAVPYPGSPLRQGSTGANVAYIQRSLNLIRATLPVIPAVEADSIFGPATRGAVISFQNLFGLTADGIVGSRTWDAINSIRASTTNGCLNRSVGSAKPLPEQQAAETAYPISVAADLPVMHEASGDNDMKIYREKSFAGRQLSVGSFGREVLTLKHRLSEVSGEKMSVLGDNFLYGIQTRRAVEDFQRSCGLPVSGTVDFATWERLFN